MLVEEAFLVLGVALAPIDDRVVLALLPDHEDLVVLHDQEQRESV